MPKPDLSIYPFAVPQPTIVSGIPVRGDVMFTNTKGEERPRGRKKQEKIISKLEPALRRVLLPEETVLFASRCQSPLTLLEQLTSSAWTAYLAAAVIVFTNARILFFPVKRDGTWRESVRSVQWGDLTELKPTGWLTRSLPFKFRDGNKITYTRLPWSDAKKIAGFAPAMVLAGAGQPSPQPGMVQHCPDCRGRLTPAVYSCAGCGLTFKNEKSMILRSIFLPGGGYFYTGHPLVAILPAVVEVILIIDVAILLAGGLRAPHAMDALVAILMYFAFVWFLETTITIFHCRRYIREFIPDKRDPARAGQSLAANARS